MSEKILSVSIASYNIEKYIEEAVNSLVVNDVIDDLEIIIVNDGSVDDTSLIAHRLESTYPNSIIVVDKANGGYGSTINTSIKRASGKYFKLLDGDDWFESSELVDYVSFLKESEADLIVSPYYRVNENKELYDLHYELSCEEAELEKIAVENDYFVMHEIAIKTQILQNANIFITENCTYTDVEYVCNCFLISNTIARYSKPVYCYRLGVEGQSVSLTGTRKNYKSSIAVMKNIYAVYQTYYGIILGAKKQVVERWLTNITRNTYIALLVLEDPDESKKELKKNDAFLKKEYPVLYKITNRSKLIRGLRTLGFKPYNAWRKRAIGYFSK